MNQAHCPSIIIWPDGFGTKALFALQEGLRHIIQSILPVDLPPLPSPFGAVAFHWLQQSVRMVGPLGITGDLGADHTSGIAIVRCAANLANSMRAQQFYLQRTC